MESNIINKKHRLTDVLQDPRHGNILLITNFDLASLLDRCAQTKNVFSDCDINGE